MRDHSGACEFAEDVELFLSVPLHDCSTGVETALAADEFQPSLRDRMRADHGRQGDSDDAGFLA